MLNQKIMVVSAGLAAVAIGKYSLTAYASEGAYKAATAATDVPSGVSTDVDVKLGKTVDVIESGHAPVIFGAAVAYGDALTTDANSHAVKAAAGDYVYGYARSNGVANDIGVMKVDAGAKAS